MGSLAVGVSAGATLLAAVLLVAALRNLVVHGRPLPAQKLAVRAASWLGLATFLFGMALGRAFWQ